MRLTFAIALPLLFALTAHAGVVSGRVTNTQGTGIPDVDLDFVDRDTGQSIPLVNDNTDFLGFYAVTVPNGDYDVRFEPAPGARYVGFEERNFRVEGASQNLDQELESGWFLTGNVVDEGSAPVANLDLDFVDSVDGPIFIANDRTDATGSFSVVVPIGTFDIEFEPDVGSQLAPQRVDAVVVGGDTALGQVVLPEGALLSGTVLAAGSALAGVQIRLIDPATGLELFAIRNSTDVLGGYDFVVEKRLYDLLLVPPRGAPALPRRLGGVDVQAATVLPPITLDPGVLASGIVRGPGNVPAEATDLDFVEQTSDIPRLTPRDNADENGQYAIAVPAGTYEIDFTPPGPSGWAPARLSGVSLLSDATLPTVQLQTGRTVSGQVRNSSGTPLPGVDLDFLVAATGTEIYTDDDNANVSGDFTVVVPSGTYDIVFSPVDGSGAGQLTLPSVAVSGNLNLGTVTLPATSGATLSAVTPPAASASGGTPVTVTGSGFAPGVEIRLGGARLEDVVLINGSTAQGTTAAHPRGTVAVSVTNPGSTTSAQLPAGFTYTVPAAGPVLSIDKGGPLGTDLLLDWSGVTTTGYSVFRSTTASGFGMSATILDVAIGTSYRDDGGASTTSPPLLFYVVQ